MLRRCLVAFSALSIIGTFFVAPADFTPMLCESALEVIIAVAVSLATVALRERARGKRAVSKDGLLKLVKTSTSGQLWRKSSAPPSGGSSCCTEDSSRRAAVAETCTSPSSRTMRPSPACRGHSVSGAHGGDCAASKPQLLITAVRRGRVSELPKLLDDAYAVALRRGGREAAAEQAQASLLTVLRTCSASQKPHVALEMYDHVSTRVARGNRDLWSLLLYAASEAGAFERCADFYRRLRAANIEPTGHDVVNAVRAMAHMQDVTGLESMLEDLRASQCRYDGVVRNRCLAACCADSAFDLVSAIKGSAIFHEPCDAAGYNTVMRGFMRRGQLTRCLDLYEEMLMHRVTPTEVTLSVLVEAAVRTGDPERAHQLLDDFRGFGVEPNRVHYTTLLRGLLLAGEQKKVSKLLNLMEEGSANIAPDLITYQSLVKAYADWGDVSSAVHALEQAIKRGLQPDGHMFNTVLYACSMAPLGSTEVFRIFDLLVGHGLTPSASSLVVLLKALQGSRDWTAAVKFLEDVPRRFGITLQTRMYAQLGLACLKANEFDRAVEIHDAMLNALGSASVNDSASGGLLQSCVSCKSLAEAKTFAFESPTSSLSKRSSAASLRSATVSPSRLNSPPRRLAQFIAKNNLDGRCESLLRSIPAEQAEWVMDQGFVVAVDPAKGTASARVVGAVQRAKHAGVCWQYYPTDEVLEKRVSEFIELNLLDQRAVREVQKLSRAQREWVMDQGFVVHATAEDPSVSNAVIRLADQSRNMAKSSASLGALIEDFATINQLDDRCVRTLRSLPRADVAQVIDQEGLYLKVDWSKGSASAKVIGMITRLRAGDSR